MTLTNEQRLAYFIGRLDPKDMSEEVRQEIVRELEDPGSELARMNRESAEFARKLDNGGPGLVDLEAILEMLESRRVEEKDG